MNPDGKDGGVTLVAHDPDDILAALDYWLQLPDGTDLTLVVRGATLHYPGGPTERQFESLVTYASDFLGEGGETH